MVAVWMPNGTLYAFLGKDGDRLSITDRFGLVGQLLRSGNNGVISGLHQLQDIATGLEYRKLSIVLLQTT
jgi:hypothetical protein